MHNFDNYLAIEGMTGKCQGHIGIHVNSTSFLCTWLSCFLFCVGEVDREGWVQKIPRMTVFNVVSLYIFKCNKILRIYKNAYMYVLRNNRNFDIY
jgi:hypothetical protein